MQCTKFPDFSPHNVWFSHIRGSYVTSSTSTRNHQFIKELARYDQRSAEARCKSAEHCKATLRKPFDFDHGKRLQFFNLSRGCSQDQGVNVHAL